MCCCFIFVSCRLLSTAGRAGSSFSASSCVAQMCKNALLHLSAAAASSEAGQVSLAPACCACHRRPFRSGCRWAGRAPRAGLLWFSRSQAHTNGVALLFLPHSWRVSMVGAMAQWGKHATCPCLPCGVRGWMGWALPSSMAGILLGCMVVV
ncbi:hypothetical protein B0T24DRAFT_15940 [Lasiosphaeria ovina]|uniref:Secreted protein n=1 Tax=Lasiosphaeria ovina TaxID=92902 RepID=A0AAE0TWV7_9PEZI|nr:hypothetical protein B0T24DRAFT_15940 [Lasiosphaeria ovina]